MSVIRVVFLIHSGSSFFITFWTFVYKYDFKVAQKIVNSGISKDLEIPEGQHQVKWPKGHIVQVGDRTTEEAAREWEETKHKS
mgnify:CR=1 FL=1